MTQIFIVSCNNYDKWSSANNIYDLILNNYKFMVLLQNKNF